nr:NFX1-type zinc finger-containing protein 1-like [Pogona vitticeps]
MSGRKQGWDHQADGRGYSPGPPPGKAPRLLPEPGPSRKQEEDGGDGPLAGLEGLCLHPRPKEILAFFTAHDDELARVLGSPGLSPRKVYTVLRAVRHGLEGSVARQEVQAMLGSVLQPTFLLQSLLGFIANLESFSGEDRRVSPEVMGDTVAALHHLLEASPGHARTLLCYPLDLLWAAVRRLQSRGFQFTWIAQKQLQDTRGLLDRAFSSSSSSSLRGGLRGVHAESLASREDFRLIPVFPTPEDIFLEPMGRLKPNVLSGQYESEEAYLDTHFRLLREDLLRPLREGISSQFTLRSLFSDSQKPAEELQLYRNVQLVSVGTSPAGVTFLAKFHPSRSVMAAASSKRLLGGSLVCLISNDCGHVIFGTVAGATWKERLPGAVWLDLQQSHARLMRHICRTTFTMVESPAFFESYRHVLAGLQELQPGSVPFSQYLVRCSREVSRPSYLEVEGAALDVHALHSLRGNRAAAATTHAATVVAPASDASEDSCVQVEVPLVDLSAVSPLNAHLWTPRLFPHLDESQISALRMALSTEFALIQGPPGTGKTFIGLKLLEVLLDNQALWNQDRTPCLVVCYTNHALDQFLEGILEFLPSGVVRIGGRSKNEKVMTCSLKNCRKTYMPGLLRLRALRRQKESISYCTKVLELLRQGVLTEWELEAEMAEDCLGISEGGMLQWLNICFPPEKGQPPRAERRNAARLRRKGGDAHNAQLSRCQKNEERFLDDDYYDEMDDEESASSGTPQGKFAYLVPEERQTHQAWLLNLLKEGDTMTHQEVAAVRDVRSLRQKDRWRLYRRWVAAYEEKLKASLVEKMKTYEKDAAQLDELRFQEDLAILRRKRVIGMTTTGAAKYRKLLQKVRPRIVIVEEAAEILEAHVLTSLSSSCQHLILIGDHQQLRPKPADYTLEKKYGLGISLFERMVNNQLPHVQLLYQHRMRPEISQLLVPCFYKELHDHQAVLEYENIKGVEKNVFFVQHEEEESHSAGTESYSNLHEATFLVSLASYLLKQGYSQSQITVLTPYHGQVMRIRTLLLQAEMEHVDTHAVDDFQGEENDIVLLSLVRSNRQGRIGFLKDKNRLCVALSRAKKGFYCIGNLEVLSACSPLWKEMAGLLKAKGLLGEELSLMCQNHPETKTAVKESHGFRQLPDGGCTLECQVRLECGHPCARHCHPTDRDHRQHLCKFPCARALCELSHPCPKKCWEHCGPCKVEVPKVIPKCGHSQNLPCHESAATWICKEPCQQLLKCSHRCHLWCGEDCQAARCKETVEVTLSCSHVTRTECFRREMPLRCHEKCRQKLDCGHACRGSCFECVRGRLHTACQKKCARVLLCSHTCQGSCCENCPPCARRCPNRCCHSFCDRRCGELCFPCRQPCRWRCPHFQCTRRCSEICNRPRCDAPCQKILKCRHPCVGLCGEPCPPKCRVCHRDELAEIFFGNEDEPDARFVVLWDCRHVLEVGGLDRWMEGEPSPAAGAREVQQKVCPKCSTPIQDHPRYNNILKATRQRMEEIKQKIRGTEEELQVGRTQLVQRLSFVVPHASCSFDPGALARKIRNTASLQDLKDWENTVSFLLCLQRLKSQAATCTEERKECLMEEAERMASWLSRRREGQAFTRQQLRECRDEAKRLSYLANLFQRLSRWETSQAPSSPEAVAAVSEALRLLNGQRPFTEAEEALLRPALEALDRLLPASGPQLSEVERLSVVEAMRFGKGQWYQCPRGHLYTVGQCGRPMEESQCPECGATIGGHNHRLRPDNLSANPTQGARDRGREEGRQLTNIAEFMAPSDHLALAPATATVPPCEPGESPSYASDSCGEAGTSPCASSVCQTHAPPVSPTAGSCQLLGSEPEGTLEEEEEEEEKEEEDEEEEEDNPGTPPLSGTAMTGLADSSSEEDVPLLEGAGEELETPADNPSPGTLEGEPALPVEDSGSPGRENALIEEEALLSPSTAPAPGPGQPPRTKAPLRRSQRLQQKFSS